MKNKSQQESKEQINEFI